MDNERIRALLRQIDNHLCGYHRDGDGPAPIEQGIIILDRVRKLWRALGPQEGRFPDDLVRFDRD